MAEGASGKKIFSLESLRGLAAFAVVLDHFFSALFPHTLDGESAMHTKYEWFLSNTPLQILINGPFAVSIFFVLSGFVLSYGYFKHPETYDLIGATIKRYFRLTPIVLAAILFSFLLLKLNLYFNDDTGLMSLYVRDNSISVLYAIWQGLAGIYIVQPGIDSLNPVFWTIYYEMIGSVLVFATLALLGRDRRRTYVYPFIILILLSTHFSGFIIGMVLADLYVNRQSLFDSITKLPVFYKMGLLFLGVYLGSFPPIRTVETIGRIHQPLFFITGNYEFNRMIIHNLAAIIFIVLLLCSRRLNRFLEFRVLTKLGGASYSLYATHQLILWSVGFYVFMVATRHGMSYISSAGMALAVYVPTALLVSEIFRRYVDVPSIALSRKVGELVHRK